MQLDVDVKRIERGAIDEIAEQLVGDVNKRVDDEINQRIDKVFDSTVEKTLSDAIRKATEDALDRNFTSVDVFGKPVGEPTTVREQLSKVVDTYWSQKVDHQGRPVASDNYSYRDKPTRAQFVMMEICKEDLKQGLRQQIVNAVAEIKDGFRRDLRAQVDKWLGEILPVRTEVDKAEKRRV